MSIHLLRNAGLCVVLIAATLPLANAAESAAIEGEITRLEHVWNDAYGANDLPKYFSYYSDGAILVFYNERTTVSQYRTLWEKTTRAEPVQSATITDMKVHVGPSNDTAVASYQLEVHVRHANSKVTVEHAFETDIWFKRGNDWRITAVHYSTANTPPK